MSCRRNRKLARPRGLSRAPLMSGWSTRPELKLASTLVMRPTSGRSKTPSVMPLPRRFYTVKSEPGFDFPQGGRAGYGA